MNIQYMEKYIKYKNKYIKLKKLNGGAALEKKKGPNITKTN